MPGGDCGCYRPFADVQGTINECPLFHSAIHQILPSDEIGGMF